MTSTVESFSWRFGGPLAGLPPSLAWSILGAIGVAGAVWIIIGYRRTLVSLTPRRRLVLSALRLFVWLLLLVALAGPTRIQRTYAQKETRPLAVLIDRSDSMTAADNRGARRADDALRRWRALSPAAVETFGATRTFAFADDFVSISSPEANARLKTTGTRVFGALQRTLAEAPPGGWGGIVVLTDGLDTSGEETGAALNDTVRTALAAATPVFPLPGRNRFAGGEFLALRDLSVPARVPPRSTFRLEITLDSFQSAPRTLPLRLKVGDTWHDPENLRLDTGRRALAWSIELPAGAPGVIPIELVAGNATDAPRAHAEVLVSKPDSTRILYYQGALDWGYRFLADILRRDPSFTLTTIFNLAPDGRRRAPSQVETLPDLPDTAAGYNAFDMVVLANAAAAQLSAAQQAALSTWVGTGGVLLFLAPDNDATRGFAGSELEKMLPVVFADAVPAAGEDPNVTDFRERMREVGGSRESMEVPFARDAARNTRAPALSAFAWEPNASELFGSDLAKTSPLFANYARVARAKPGAVVLARHPRDLAPASGEHAILLAFQRYGRGQSAVLTSDALWRWKLNQPSSERGVEKFWQNLLAWLGRERPRSLRFDHAPLQVQKGQEILVRIAGATGPLTVTASPSEALAKEGRLITLAPAGDEKGVRLFRWTPAADGPWVLSARAGEGEPVRHWLNVTVLTTGENSGLPTDEALLQTLAQRTGGTLLGDTPPPAWRGAAGQTAALLRETAEPLWHQGWILAAILTAYALELVLRRRWQLL